MIVSVYFVPEDGVWVAQVTGGSFFALTAHGKTQRQALVELTEAMAVAEGK